MWNIRSLISVLLVSSILHVTHAKLIEQDWVISLKEVTPDGVPKVVPVVNGQYPGPVLRGHVGDDVQIRVHNNLPTDSTSIHWHGIKQTATPWSDGTPGVTQCAIGPAQSFLYQFKLDLPGTLWWHSHSGFQKSSLYGAIIVYGDEKYIGKHEERILLLNDWYHADADTQIEGLSRPHQDFKWVFDPQSMLFNGRGKFNCSQTKKDCDPMAPDSGPDIIDVKPSTTYRLRIVGASSLAFINFGIHGHQLKMVEAETSVLRPFRTKFLDIGSGQSFSALLRTKSRKQLEKLGKKNNGLFWMQIYMRHRKGGPIGFAILRYNVNNGEKVPREKKELLPTSPEQEDIKWSLRHARRFKLRKPVELPKPRRTFVYLGTQNDVTDGPKVWAMNNISMALSGTPLLHSMALDIESEKKKWIFQPQIPTPYDYNLTLSQAGLSESAKIATQVLPIAKDEVVDFVFQNTRSLGGAPEVHPWHMHLHNFWVLGFGEENETWSEKDIKSYNTRRPVSRNTFTLYPGSWTAIRLKADNPGMAFFHCHIISHLQMGMGFVLQIGETPDVPRAPQGTQFCGVVPELSASLGSSRISHVGRAFFPSIIRKIQ